jgi:hypothetical protein
VLSGLEPVIDGRFGKAGFSEVVCYDFRFARHRLGKLLFKCARNLGMQLLPAALEQIVIRRVPYQRVFEAVDGFRRIAATKHERRLL